jgi:hypothetical protein
VVEEAAVEVAAVEVAAVEVAVMPAASAVVVEAARPEAEVEVARSPEPAGRRGSTRCCRSDQGRP